MKKRLTALTLSLAMMSLIFAGCSSKDDTAQFEEKDSYTIGVIQFGSHPSLDNCYAGVEKAIKDSELADKITIDFQNGNFDTASNDSIAKNMVSQNYDLIIPIATPSAISAFGATEDIPIVFCAISDPIAAGLVESFEKPNTNATGTSNSLDHEAQLDLITALQPDVKKIGVLYTTSEANSISELSKLREAAQKRNIEIVDQGVQSSSDIPQAMTVLVSKVDAITNLTDNNVVNNLGVVIEAAEKANIPVYGSEVEQVLNGALATEGIDYVNLGYETGKMAIEVLNGREISTFPVLEISKTECTINRFVARKFGIEIPESYFQTAEIIDIQ